MLAATLALGVFEMQKKRNRVKSHITPY